MELTKKKTFEQKISTHFGVKIAEGGTTIKAVDEESRTIKAIGNTYYLIDSDGDMLVKGCSVKSINDRGPQSNATAKIKFQSDHILNTKNAVGRFTVIDERVIDNNTVLYFEGFIPDTRKGNDDLTNYKSGIYDNHSIGFRYKVIEIADANSDDLNEQKNWNEFYPLAINPEVADAMGFFWVVKEIELFEISVVSFGANKLTPYLGSKSKEENNKIKTDLLERVNELNAQLKSASESKEERKNIDLEFLQLKQIITDLKLEQPIKQTTPQEPVNTITETIEESNTNQKLINNISKFL